MLSWAWLTPLFPLLAFAIIIFFSRQLRHRSAYMAIGSLALSFIFSVIILALAIGGKELTKYANWLKIGTDLSLSVGFSIDPLAALMLFIVSCVGLAIFIYSIGYMHGDPRYPRYFAYMSLFAGSMLGLVISNNFLQLYCCWELVGLCSYLLIGFWFERPAAARAAKKAFLVTRTGDLGLLIGILLLFFHTNSLDFEVIFSGVRQGFLSPTVLTVSGLLIFCGAVGKSAQFPLHVWLPDAMEGPTPVSALIHAATMVAAGVFLVARTYPIFHSAQGPLLMVAYIGGITSFMAATIGLAMNDIKRVLAYSTISQLGYMMMALGVGGYAASVFHLMTHAFFKALLFLCAGSVIHTMQTNDMMEMGGLAKKMKITFWTFLIGAGALIGIPPLSGFWSKDEILVSAWHTDKFVFSAGLLTVFFTALYMSRTCFLTFGGTETRKEIEVHESPPVMTVPLISLAFFACFSGFIGSFLTGNPFHKFIHFTEAHAQGANYGIMLASIGIAGAGIAFAWATYQRGIISRALLIERFKWFYLFLKNKWYFDEAYNIFIVRPLIGLSKISFSFDLGIIDWAVNAVGFITVIFSKLYGLFDLYVIDGLVNLIAWITGKSGESLRRIQTGLVQNYMLIIFLGLALLLLIALIK